VDHGLRTPKLYFAAGLAAAAAALLLLLWVVRREREDASPVAEVTAPAGASAATGLELDLPPPRSSVEALRQKTMGGADRFLVEAVHDELEPRLGLLKQAFADPTAPGAPLLLDDLLTADFTSSPLTPASERVLKADGGVRARALSFAAGSVERGRFLAEVQALIRPLARLELAAFKVIHLDGDMTRGPFGATVIYELAGAGADGRRRQWTGTARLEWRRAPAAGTAGPWQIARFATLDGVATELAAKPFVDATRIALGANPCYETLLVPGIDDFRARLDAASGIDVYGHHGLAAGDFNADGLDDLYVAMPPGLPAVLLQGRGDGTFADAGAASGTNVLDGVSQPLFIDLENDGDQDLFLVSDAGLLLLANDGAGRFRDASSGLPEVARARATPISAAAADYDRDGFIDVYVCSYVFWRGNAGEVGSRLPFPYHEAHNGAPNFLFRNLGDGSFEDATEKAGLNVRNSRFSFAAAWGDYDADGDPDLYVANDFGSKNLYRNEGNGTFREVTAEAGVEDVGAGMSVAWEDYDGDGDLDLYVGNMFSSAGRRVTGTADYKSDQLDLQRLYRRHARGNTLFRNRGDGTFEDVSEETRALFGRWAWASGFIDFNLDGREDLYVQNGFISNTRKDDL
jgi:hypothetical protein